MHSLQLATAAPCSSSRALAPSRISGRLRRQPPTRAQQQGGEGPSPPPVDEEARLEALEASMRAKKPKAQAGTARARAEAEAASEVAWKEGSLLPEKWAEMDFLERANQIYMGKYGALYWANKAAWFSCIGIGVAWVLFRIVLPVAGVYTLADDPGTPY